MADCTMIATEKRKEKCPYLLVRRVKILFSREKKKKITQPHIKVFVYNKYQIKIIFSNLFSFSNMV